MYHLIPSFHYDVIYLKNSREYTAIGSAIIERALKLLEQSTDYTFTIEQTILLEEYLDQHPEALQPMRRLAGAGRLEFAPGMYVMPDMNLTDGESLYRQVYFGFSFLEKRLGIVPTACWIADCWGHHAQLPQILTQCGYSSYFFWRCMRRDVAQKDFWWEGLDGTRILTHWLSNGYSGLHFRRPEVENAGEQAFVTAARSALQTLVDAGAGGGDRENYLIPNGGDFCMPEAESLTMCREISGQLPMALHFSTPSFYSHTVDRRSLAVFSGEFTGSFQGTYTSNIWIKQRTEIARTKLISLEKLCAVTGRNPDLTELWKRVLKCQFHDTICGTICDDGIVEAEADLAWIEAKLAAFSAMQPHFVFNPLGCARRERVAMGDRVFDVNLPAFSTVPLAEAEEVKSRAEFLPLPGEYANSFYRCELDVNGCITSLCRKDEKELVAAGARLGLLSMQIDNGDNWLNFAGPLDGGCHAASLTDRHSDPWHAREVPLLNNRTILPSFQPAEMSRRTRETVVRQRGSLAFWQLRIEFETQIIFYDDSPLIRYRTRITPRGKHFRLRVAFPTAVRQGEMSRAVPFGIQRGDHSELPAAGFFDYRDGERSISVLGRGLYGSCVDEDGVMLLSLFRSTAMEYKCESCRSFNEGRHLEFDYALLPGQSGYDFSELTKQNDLYTFAPLFSDSPARSSSVNWDFPENIRLSAFKRTPVENVFFCRLAETAGHDTNCLLSTGTTVVSYAQSDGLERKKGEPILLDGTLLLHFRAFEIKNILLYFNN